MKKTQGQNTTEFLILSTAVTIFFIIFAVTGFPIVTKKQVTNSDGVKVWVTQITYGGSPFLTIFARILRNPGDTARDEFRDTTHLDSYGEVTIFNLPPPSGNFLGRNGQLADSIYQNGCLAMPGDPTKHFQYGLCYTGPGSDPTCTQQVISGRSACVCPKGPPLPPYNLPKTNCLVDISQVSTGHQYTPFWVAATWAVTCPAASPPPVNPTPPPPGVLKECGALEPDHPPTLAITGCYPGIDYKCWEVSCIPGSQGAGIPGGVVFNEFIKICSSPVSPDTCPDGDAAKPYTCKPGDDFDCYDVFLPPPINYAVSNAVGSNTNQYTMYSIRDPNPILYSNDTTTKLYQRNVSCKNLLSN